MKGAHAKEKESLCNTFSKKIVIAETIGRWLLVIFCCIMIAKTDDLTPFAYLIPLAEVLAGIVYGGYFNKAKAENVAKITTAEILDETGGADDER